VLVGFCAAAFLLAFSSAVPVIAAAKRTQGRLDALQRSHIVFLAESLQLQVDRLGHIAAHAAPLAGRATSAVQSIQESLRAEGLRPARDALAATGAQLRALLEDLR
jgi:hypothetical protein